MSRILSRISMPTGQFSSHALHDVHDQISSGVMRSNSESAVMVISGTVPMGGGGGAHARAPPAHGAGVGVEQLLPREVLDGGGAEALELRLHEVGQRLHRA